MSGIMQLIVVAGGGGTTITGGQQEYTTPGTYSWTAPVGVTSVSVVCIGGGGGAATVAAGITGPYPAGGGGGGALYYVNNTSVTPGDSYTVVVGAKGNVVFATSSSAYGTDGGNSSFGNTICVAAGGQGAPSGGIFGYGGNTGTGNQGGAGGRGGLAAFTGTPRRGGGGGGAGGYSGNGGNGGDGGDGAAGGLGYSGVDGVNPGDSGTDGTAGGLGGDGGNGGAAGGVSTTNLQGAYDNSNSNPEILTNATLGPVNLRRGSAVDTDNVLTVQNGTGTDTIKLRADGQLTLNGPIVLNTSSTSGLTTGTTSIVSFTASAGNGAYFDYHLSGASNQRRTGTIMSTWNGSDVAFTDTSTPDLNGSTRAIEFNVAIITGNVTLQSVVTSGTWAVDTGIRII